MIAIIGLELGIIWKCLNKGLVSVQGMRPQSPRPRITANHVRHDKDPSLLKSCTYRAKVKILQPSITGNGDVCTNKRHIFEDIVNSKQKIFYERFLRVTDFFPNLRVRADFLHRQSIIEFDNYLLTRRRFSLFG